MNLRLGKSVSDVYGAKLRLGEFKAVYSISINTKNVHELMETVVVGYGGGGYGGGGYDQGKLLFVHVDLWWSYLWLQRRSKAVYNG